MVKGGAIGNFWPAAARRPASPWPSSGEGCTLSGPEEPPRASRGASGAVGVLTLLRCAPQRRRVHVDARWARALRRSVGLPLERAAPPSGHVLPPLLREGGHAPAQAPRARSQRIEGAEARAQARTRGEHQAVGTRPCEGGGRDPRTCPIAGRSAPLRRRAAASRDWPPRPPPPPPPPLRCAAPPQQSPRAGRALRVAHARRACVGRVRVSMAKRGGIGRRWRGATTATPSAGAHA